MSRSKDGISDWASSVTKDAAVVVPKGGIDWAASRYNYLNGAVSFLWEDT